MGDGPAKYSDKRSFGAILGGALVLDATTGRILQANNAAATILSFASPEEMVGQNPLDYVPDEDRQPVAVLLAQGLETDRPTPAEIRVKTKDGRLVWLSVTSALIEHEGKRATLIAMREITSEKTREAALMEAERLYQRLFETMLDGAAVLDVATTQVLLANQAAASMLGFASPEEMVSENPLDYVPKEDQERVVHLVADSIERGYLPPTEIRLRNKDGRLMWVSLSASLIEHGGKKATLAIIRDITSDKEREAALREAESRYERLFDGMPDGAVVLDVSTFEIALANKAAAEMAGFDSPREVVGINPLSFIPEEDRDEVTRMIALNLEGKGPNPAEIRLVSRDKREIWVSATATRIEYEGRTATLATLRDITADKAKDAALRAAEESRLRLMDAAAEAITIVQDGELVYVNPAVARGAGIPEQQLIGLPFLDLVHPEEKQAVWQRYERIMAGEWPPEIATIRGVDAKGETLWAEVREIPFTWQGKPAVMSLIRNITEEVKAQEALRDSEEHFRTLIEKATDVVIVLDASGKITYQSPSLERVTGFGHNEWLDRSLGELLIHPDDMPYLAATLERILAKPGATFEGITVRYQHKDRSWHTLEATVTNMLHDPKVNGIVANFRDITDRKATEEALKRSEALLKATETLTGTGGWEYDVQTGAMAWTDETYRIHEVPKVPTIDHISESLKCYPPPARQVIEEAFQKCVKEGITYDLELPFITFGGNQRWVRTCAKAIREGDRIVRVLGNIADITERKRMEDALRTSEERNRLLVENASEVIAVIQDGLLKLINPKVTDFVGYLPEELVFRPFAELVYPDDRQMVADNYVRRLSGEQLPNNYQFRVTHKNGGVRWAEISVALFEWEGRPATLALLNDITERREAETALRESEERFRQIAENMLDAISLLDANGIIKYASPSHQRIVGYAPEDMVGKSVFDFVPPEDVDDLTAYVARMQGEAGFAFRYRFRHSDGHYIWGEASAKILHDDAGNVSGYVIASKDVTDRRNAEEALRASEAKYRRLFESTQTAMEVIDMTTGLVALANEATARMFGFASPDDLVGIDSMQYLRPEDIGWVAEKMAQAVTDSSWQEIAELQVRTNDGRWLWISGMVIQSEYQGKPALLVSLLDITSRKHAEETLRESEQKYRLLTEKTNDVIYTIDLDLNNTYVSPSVERILGFTPEEYLAIGPDQRMTLESLARAQEALLEHLSLENDPKADPNRTVRIELEFYRKDGSTAWLEHQVSGLRDANGIAIGLHGVARDIEERRKAEQAVRESEQKYRLLANKTNDIIWTSDLTLHTTYVSPSVEKILGFTPEERLAQDPTQQMTPESSARAAEALAQHLALDQDPKADPSRTLRIELEYYRKDGSTIWLENQVSGIRDASGKLIGFHGVARDVTERRKSEQALRESEEKYRLLAEKTTDLIWTSDINMRPTYMSPSVEMIIGITPEEGLGRNLAAIMTPESLARATEVLAHHLALEEDPSADPNRTLKVELEFYRKDGSTVWLEEHVSGIRDTDGKLVGFHGVARDVSDRKRMEDSLDERLKELQCIAGISRLAERPELPVEEFVRGVVGLLPPAWHYPESCAARIALDSKEFKTENYRETDWSQSADIRVDEKKFGTVTVCYLEEMPQADEGPFLKEERDLIDTIADFMGHVIQHRQMEQSLRASEERYRLLAQNASDIIWVLDADFKFSYLSPSVTTLLGYGLDEIVGHSFDGLLTPDSMLRMAEVYIGDMDREDAMPGAMAHRLVEIEAVCKDGSTVWLEAAIKAVRNEEGRITGFQGACRDITERRRTQEELAATETNYRNLFNQTLLGMEVVDSQTGKVVLANHAIARMFGFSSPEEMVGLDAITGWVLPEDMEWVLREFAKAMADPDKRDVATLRIKGKDGRMVWVSGSGTLFDYEGRPALLISLINVTAARDAEDRLRESEEKNRLLIDNAAEGIIVVQDGVLKFVNRKCIEFVGYSAEELVSRSFADFVHPDERQRLAEYYVRRMSGEEVPATYQSRVIDKQGNTKWAEISATVFPWEGKPAVMAMLSDITERVIAEQALRDSEERFRTIIENAQDAVTIVDENFNVMYESPSLGATTGYLPEEWLGKSLADMQIHPDDLPLLALEFEKLKSQPRGVIENVCVRYKHRDGSWHVIEATARNLMHDFAVKGIVVNFRDVTERKHAEEAQRESELRYRLLAENATDIIWVVDVNLRVTYASPSVTKLLGYTTEDIADSAFVDKLLTPDSLSSMAKEFVEDLAAEEAKPGTLRPRLLEIEVVSKDGSKIWLEAATSAIRDAEGRLVGFQGACRNITDRKEAEELLRASEERFRGLVETTSDWVWEIDRNSRYTYVSPRVRDILGREPEEILGHTPFEFMHQRESRRVSKIVRRFAAEHLPFSLLENTCVHKDGHAVVMETSAVPIIGSDGGFLGYRGIDRDITERKKAEQELQRSLKRLEKTMESTIEAITTTIETRDPYTTGHQMRVTELACAIAKVMEVPPTQIEGIRVAGLLHDIGKIAIPTEILSKPGKLNEVEYEMIKTHSKVGYNILKKIEFPWPVARTVLQHHERWNGSGYPHGIRGEDILLEARILAVADVMEAMSSHRPYRPSIGADKALDEISKNSGILYDPAVAEACITAFTQAGFKFAPSLPSVATDLEGTSASHPAQYPEDD